jgi:hypothetical protein
VHKHIIKIGGEKHELERTRKRRMEWTMARKRTLQQSAALAETWLAIWQRSMLVAL